MKNTGFILIIAVICLQPFSFGTEGPVAWWTFDEGQGSTVYDFAGGNDGTIHGNPQWTTGEIGGALDFDGDNDYVIGENSPFGFENTSFSVCSWFKTNGSNGSSGTIISEGGYEGGWLLNIMPDYHEFFPGCMRVMIKRNNSTNTAYRAVTRDRYDDGQWHHVVAIITTDTVDKNGNNADIYIDGQLQDLQDESFVWPYGQSEAKWRMGCRPVSTTYLDGILDEVMIFDRALSANEIKDLYENGWPEPNITGIEIQGSDEIAEQSQSQYRAIAYYDNGSISDVTGQVLWAVEPNKYAQVDQGGLVSTDMLVMPQEQVTLIAQYENDDGVFVAEKDVTIQAMCPKGNALKFDGRNDIVPLGGMGDFGSNLAEQTMSVYVKSFLSNKMQVIFIGAAESQGHTFIRLALHADNNGNILPGAISFALRDENGKYLLGDVNYDTGITDQKWHHIAVASKANSNLINIYVDGVAQTVTYKYKNTPSNFANLTHGLRMGSNTVFNTAFDGLIDEAAIFDYALTPMQIQALVHAGPDGSDPNLVGYWDFEEGAGQVAYDLSGNGNDGFLGSDPCGVDVSDPCWVQPGAPQKCTPRQVLKRNLNGTMQDKEAAQRLINKALDKEKASMKILASMFRHGDRGKRKSVIGAYFEIFCAVQKENQSLKKLYDSIDCIKKAILWLYDFEPEPHNRSEHPKTNPHNNRD